MKSKIVSIVLILAFALPGLATPASAATQSEIDQAIDSGLAWLAAQQSPDGRIGYSYPLAETAMAVLAFENEGHFPGAGNLYSATVEKGLDFIFGFCHPTLIVPQTVGYPGRNDNPDTNGNNLGISFFTLYSYQMYETGMVMQAIVASNTTGRLVTTGACSGMTYQQVMEDLVDFVAMAQVDGGPGRGGWYYYAYNNIMGYADNSNSQWPALGLIAAEQWGISAPPWVKDELGYWVTFIQSSDGGSGYNLPNQYSWPSNVSRTGGLLVEFSYLGDDATTLRVQRALELINLRWNGPLNVWDGNKGHPYAMFAAFKGLELLQVAEIPNAPANDDTSAGDWWGDYSDYLVNTQYGNGSWSGYYYYWGPYLATPWYIIILQATVFPVSVEVVVPGAACDITGYEVDVHYSVERFTANGTLNVYKDGVLFDTITLIEFKGSATKTYNIAPETVGDHTWKAVLDVTGGGITAHAEDTDTGSVYATPQVSNIPDQVAPFSSFDLDDYQTCECANVEWSASGVPDGWTVTIDEDHVVTVTAPEGAYTPAEITFTGIFHWEGIDCTGSDIVVFSPNQPPVADAGKQYPNEKYEVDEGGSVQLDGSGSYDPDEDSIISYDWDLDADTIFETPGATPTFSAAGLDGPSEVYVYLKVCDEHGACDIDFAEVEIENVAPTIESISAPLDPVNINNQPVSVEMDFSDPGIPDTHEVNWEWGDGNSDTQTDVSSPAIASHTYAEAGVYNVIVTVTDDDGGSDSEVYQYIVIYDPNAGFVTGGGWIMSPEGAYTPDPSLEGKANFGFVSKYKKGTNVPDGNTEFQFNAGDLNFHSSNYEWLVVTGNEYAMFKGCGTINGMGDYKFRIWAGDDDPDTFRIKIWEEDEFGVETVIYDNGMDQPIEGGSIVIHK